MTKEELVLKLVSDADEMIPPEWTLEEFMERWNEFVVHKRSSWSSEVVVTMNRALVKIINCRYRG